MTEMRLTVDGLPRVINVDDDLPLLYALRNELNLKNPRFGCGLSQCGACTVHLDGEAIRSCVTLTSAAVGHEVTTLAGLGTQDNPHPVQQAFVEEMALQCGYCINAWIMTSASLIEKNPDPSDAEIREALAGLKCRCANQMSFMRAVKRAAELKAQAGAKAVTA
jgi:aerobic-type carbon monoxide dehydrogenase small subunit (CoxS/CutS family)